MNQSMLNGLNVGSIGERVAWDILQNQKNIRTVFDVRLSKRYQAMDIDFEVELTNRQIIWVEVKTDEQIHKTGNIFYEITSNADYNTQGCFCKTRADLILLYDSAGGVMYQLAVNTLRDYVENNQTLFKRVHGGDNAIGLLVSIQDLILKGIAKEIKKEASDG